MEGQSPDLLLVSAGLPSAAGLCASFFAAVNFWPLLCRNSYSEGDFERIESNQLERKLPGYEIVRSFVCFDRLPSKEKVLELPGWRTSMPISLG